MRKVFSYVGYLFLRAIFFIVRLLPLTLLYSFVRGLGWLLFKVDAKHRRVAERNLRQAFGTSKSEKEYRRLEKLAFQNFVAIALETILAPKFVVNSKWQDRMELPHAAEVKNVLSARRGVIMLVPHLGNWEVLGLCYGMAIGPYHAIARSLKNPYLDGYFRRWRESKGGKIFPRRGGLRQLFSTLRGGGTIALAPDQNQRKRPIFADFFGKKASCDRTAAFLSLKLGAPIFVAVFLRKGWDFRFHSEMIRIKIPHSVGNRGQDILNITGEINRAVEGLILKYPEQYFWLHDRYRTRPPEERALDFG